MVESTTRTMILAENSESVLAEAVAVLHAGKVIAFPTDTVYGLGAAYDQEDAVVALRKLKGRNAEKPFQVLIGSLADLEILNVEDSSLSKRLAARFWPGALTMVLPRRGGGTVGVRCPNSRFVQKLISSLGCPLVATSANPEGGATAKNAREVRELFHEAIPLIIDGGEKNTDDNQPSTVILVQDETIQVLRSGALSENEINQCAREYPRQRRNSSRRKP